MIRRLFTHSTSMRAVGSGTVLAAFLAAGALAAMAQPAIQSSTALLDGLRECRGIAASQERVVCYDTKVGDFLSAVDSGELRLVDRKEARKTRQQLFGIPMPDLAIFKGDEKEDQELSERFETTIASGRQTGQTQWRFTTAEGAIWEINNPPRKIAPIKAGDKVSFKKASLGYYFVSINGQMGVKGRRIG